MIALSACLSHLISTFLRPSMEPFMSLMVPSRTSSYAVSKAFRSHIFKFSRLLHGNWSIDVLVMPRPSLSSRMDYLLYSLRSHTRPSLLASQLTEFVWLLCWELFDMFTIADRGGSESRIPSQAQCFVWVYYDRGAEILSELSFSVDMPIPENNLSNFCTTSCIMAVSSITDSQVGINRFEGVAFAIHFVGNTWCQCNRTRVTPLVGKNKEIM